MPMKKFDGELSNGCDAGSVANAGRPAQRASKYDRLMAVFEEFFEAMSGVPENDFESICKSWPGTKASYAASLARGGTKSAIAAGLEQGAREMPMIIGASTSMEFRSLALDALSKALRSHYPDFTAKNASRLAAILSKGVIRNESQFFLVRHRIDELEGIDGSEAQLAELYLLVENFEAPRRRRQLSSKLVQT